MDTNEFGRALQEIGIYEFSGVPCSYLAPLINYAINENRFVMANNEGDAVAIASGVSLVSRNKGIYGAVLMQNSGLSNALSPLTSLNYTFDIPILGFVSLRGERDSNGKNTDEPQHELLGVITDKLLDVCEVEYEFLSADINEAKMQLMRAKSVLDMGKPFFFIVRDKTFEKNVLTNNPNIAPLRRAIVEFNKALKDCDNSAHSGLNEALSKIPSKIHKEAFDMEDFEVSKEVLSTRLQALEVIQNSTINQNCVLLATTGKCGRELYELGDKQNQLYMVGSMGCVSSLGLGISLKSDTKVLAIDGDSALLMRLGALSTNGYYAKMRDIGNFCHILLDNESHDSTGGQFNLSPIVDFAHIAFSCGYEVVRVVRDLEELEQGIKAFMESTSGGAHFIYMRIAKVSKQNLGRPKITPKEVGLRLSHFLSIRL